RHMHQNRLQDLRSLVWQNSSGIYRKACNTILLYVQEEIGSSSIMASTLIIPKKFHMAVTFIAIASSSSYATITLFC
ncbi:MAG: hypothetical protein M3382_04620, partial [Thermoproteota archaeon]|nr:hypothetical protein [Thermoproteota archaeon]